MVLAVPKTSVFDPSVVGRCFCLNGAVEDMHSELRVSTKRIPEQFFLGKLL